MSHTFVLRWDPLGLEACINISDIEKEQMWAALKETKPDPNAGRPNTVSSIVNTLMLRAKFNTQRHYEIYAIDTDDSIDEAALREMFEQDPQASADLIRSRGRQLYSDRLKKGQIKIR